MVEVEGERVLAASCIRRPTAGMKVRTQGPRPEKSRRLVFELLAADQPPRAESPDPDSLFWQRAEALGVEESRFPAYAAPPPPDRSHGAMAVRLDACIQCGLCLRGCREVQFNDIIGMAGRGRRAEIVFDLGDPMGESGCVACGECVQACPTGALIESRLVDGEGRRSVQPSRAVDTLCPYCGVGCQTKVMVAPLGEGESAGANGAASGANGAAGGANGANGAQERIVQVDGRNGPANENRLCVKGRFGFDYIHHPDRLTRPLIRLDGAPKEGGMQIARGEAGKWFREASWEEALERAASGLAQIRDEHGGTALAGFGSAKGSNEEAYLFQKLVRQGFGANNVDHCTRLCHASSVAALMEGIGSGAVTAPFTAAAEADCMIVIGARPTQNHPVAATYIKAAAERGARAYRDGSEGLGALKAGDDGSALQAGERCRSSQRDAPCHRGRGARRPAVHPSPHRGLR